MAKKKFFDEVVFAKAAGILWGTYMFFLSLVAMLFGVGGNIVGQIAGLYIGYGPTLIGSILGFVYGFVDGFVGGYVFSYLYNYFSK